METKETGKKSGKPFIIANPIYDTVFKRLMENQRIAKFFIGTILEQQVEDLSVLPQEFTYKLNRTKASDEVRNEEKEEEKGGGGVQYYSFFRLDFMATIRDRDGRHRKILIEIQKSWDTLDVMRFCRYLGAQYSRVDIIDGRETMLPMTTIYILGNNLAGIECPCVRVGRTYTDMLNKTAIHAKSEFMENLTHDSYVIQAGRIADVRYTTSLDKLLSIFEQKYFIVDGSDVRKEYPYHPDDENMELITDLLYEMGADPEKRREIEDEIEMLRIIKNIQDTHNRTVEEQTRLLEEKDRENAELKEKLAELERLFRNKTD
ncbi:MAG: hypothetical protein LBF85_06710 [Tannerella sp.]|jgi:hypothetical protein|nr:hypothetical protein [Tannerella sp.]